MYKRGLTPRLLAALSESPIVLLHGARQAGKSTLAQSVAAGPHPAKYLTLDDAALLGAATSDPTGFVTDLKGPVIIDEVQRAPDLFLAIKASVDRDRRPGRFLLTGSAQVLMLPRLSESLAGRVTVLRLYPLAQSEVVVTEGKLIDRLFGDKRLSIGQTRTGREDVVDRIIAGGYPEALTRADDGRNEWFGSYVTAILQRDVRDLAQRIERLTELPRILALLASRTATLLNVADLSRLLGIPYTSMRSYLAILQATFLVDLIPAWHASPRRRLVKAPKVLITDAGLAAHLVRADASRIASDPVLLGGLLETFVITELLKEGGWSRARPAAFHYRTDIGEEVDLVLEDRSGRAIGVDVKAAASVGDRDFRGLRALAQDAKRQFHRGVVFYLGETLLPFGDRLYAIPIPALWEEI